MPVCPPTLLCNEQPPNALPLLYRPAPSRSSGEAPAAEKGSLQDTLRKLTKHVRRQARSKSAFRMVTCTTVGAEGRQATCPPACGCRAASEAFR